MLRCSFFAISSTELLTAPVRRGRSAAETGRWTLQKYLYLLLTYSELWGDGEAAGRVCGAATKRAAEAALLPSVGWTWGLV